MQPLHKTVPKKVAAGWYEIYATGTGDHICDVMHGMPDRGGWVIVRASLQTNPWIALFLNLSAKSIYRTLYDAALAARQEYDRAREDSNHD